MRLLGYAPFSDSYSTSVINKGLESLKNSPFMFKQLVQYPATGQGTDNYPSDPTNPSSWGAPQNQDEWFVESPVASNFFEEMKIAADKFKITK